MARLDLPALWNRHAQTVDAVGALLLYLTTGLVWAATDEPLYALASLGFTLPLAWRRTAPWPAGLAMIAWALGYWLLGLALLPERGLMMPSLVGAPLMIYAMTAYGLRKSGWTALGAGLAGALMLAGFETLAPSSGGDLRGFLGAALSMCSGVAAAWAMGAAARGRRLTLTALEDRAHRLEVEREQERALAAADERNRIAREMHDIIAHSLSVVIAQADGARYAAAARPEAATEALETIAATGRASLTEMRRLLGVLRGGEATGTAPLPTLADLPALLESYRGSGLSVSLLYTGDPHPHLPRGAELTAYRTVQESLTNVLKHAGPRASATVTIGQSPSGIEVTVEDTGGGAPAGSPGSGDPDSTDPDSTNPGSGNGLTGLAERVRLYAGTFESGPLPGRGFRVHAVIPASPR